MKRGAFRELAGQTGYPTDNANGSAFRARKGWDFRHFWVLVHRYAGLYMAAFLIVVGITGSLLAFYVELEGAINPHLHPATRQNAEIDPATLIMRAEALVPEAQANGISFSDGEAMATVSMGPRTDPATGKPYALGFDQLVLDRYTGEELGRREWGAISQGLINLMPFIYKLHYQLALGDVGIWLLGIAALIWTLDCFVGFYLTLPVRRQSLSFRLSVTPAKAWVQSGLVVPALDSNLPWNDQESGAKPASWLRKGSFWRRWKPAWLIKRSRLNFDLHRAGALWLWAILLIFAWSSVYMNLWDTVYTAATRLVLDYHEPWTDLPKREKPLDNPVLDWRQAQEIGTDLMARAAATQGFTIGHQVSLRLNRELGVYVYQVRSSRDIQDRHGRTQVLFDADTGLERLLLLPSGQYDGNTVTSWLYALHMGNVFGLPYRIFVCVLGLALTMLSVTGIIIWLRKRRAAHHQHARRLKG
ncbi:MAG: PepSY-associated TM helix domain-containing protein [Gammaproteobacteria bacterium]